MREIVLDTETTGLNPLQGDRIVEIGCVEVVNYVATNATYHAYLNPERPVPEEATRVHGLTDAFLSDKPVFAEEAERFLSFIGDSTLIIHNASFDVGFLNAELKRLGLRLIQNARVVDTLSLARRLFPGAPASLDALCKRFSIDSSSRNVHGALLDAQLLSSVYLELRGGRQPGLSMEKKDVKPVAILGQSAKSKRTLRQTKKPSHEETSAHAVLLDKIKEPLWKRGA